MSDYRRQRRALLRQLAEIEKAKEGYLMRLKDARPEELQLHNAPLFQYNDRRYHLEMELEVLEAKHLLKLAEKWGYEGPLVQQQMYDPHYTGVEPRPFFTPQNKALMRKIITDARRRRIKEWVEIISPVASVVISLLAFLLAALALYLQVTRPPH